MSIQTIISAVIFVFSAILTIITTIKARKTKTTEDSKTSNFWTELFTKIPEYIKTAEQFFNQIAGKASGIKTGAQKLTQVLDKIKIDCLTAGVEYNEQKATDMVNSLVDLTNNVNTNK